VYGDGTLCIHELNFNDDECTEGISTTLNLVKQMTNSRFFLFSQTFSMKHFIILGGDQSMAVYEMQSY
jgi:hypothetical protein